MFWLITSIMLSADPQKKEEKIYVASPTIHDEALQGHQQYLTSLIVASANTNIHWVKRSKRADVVYIYDRHTIEYALDTTCNYNRPLQCGSENYHWVLITDIFTTENFATIVVKLYDQNAQLIASSSKSSYSVEKCKPQVKETSVESNTPFGRTNTEIVEILPEKCITLKPSIIDKDIKQAVTILFASIHPPK